MACHVLTKNINYVTIYVELCINDAVHDVVDEDDKKYT